MLGIPKLIIILGVLITSILYWANTNVCRYNFAIEKRTNVLNIVTEELDPTPVSYTHLTLPTKA